MFHRLKFEKCLKIHCIIVYIYGVHRQDGTKIFHIKCPREHIKILVSNFGVMPLKVLETEIIDFKFAILQLNCKYFQ